MGKGRDRQGTLAGIVTPGRESSGGNRRRVIGTPALGLRIYLPPVGNHTVARSAAAYEPVCSERIDTLLGVSSDGHFAITRRESWEAVEEMGMRGNLHPLTVETYDAAGRRRSLRTVMHRRRDQHSAREQRRLDAIVGKLSLSPATIRSGPTAFAVRIRSVGEQHRLILLENGKRAAQLTFESRNFPKQFSVEELEHPAAKVRFVRVRADWPSGASTMGNDCHARLDLMQVLSKK